MLIFSPYSRRKDDQLQSILKFSGSRNNLEEFITCFFQKRPKKKKKPKSILSELKDIAGLAIECGADFIKGFDFNGFCPTVFKHGQICHSDTHFFGEFGNAHFTFSEHNVDINYDHSKLPPYIVRSFSCLIRAAVRTRCERTADATAIATPTKTTSKEAIITDG